MLYFGQPLTFPNKHGLTIMKAIRAVFVLVVMGLILLPAAKAQKQTDSLDHLVAMLNEKLSLSTDQRARIHAILEASQNQAGKDREANKGNQILLRKAARARMKTLDKNLAAILTDQQKKDHPMINREIHRFLLLPSEGGTRRRE